MKSGTDPEQSERRWLARRAAFWSELDAIDRLAFVTQTLATLSLFPTVYFAWASYQEARLAREDQARYFYAEKAPRLEVTSIELDGGRVIAYVKNAGDSPAIEVFGTIALLGTEGKCGFRAPFDHNTTLDTDERLERSGQMALWIDSKKDQISKCEQFKSKGTFAAGPPATLSRQGDSKPWFEVTLVWKGMDRQERVARFEALP